MSETKNGDGPRPFKKVKSEENPSLYQPEPIKPEWLELPPELRKDYENSNDSSSSAAWNKCFPYTTSLHLPIVPLHQPPTFTPESPALCFQVHGICGRARAGTLHFPNGGPPVPIPRFMPVGTKGTLKGVLPSEIADMECPIILANTYHLAIQPGTDLIDEVFGGLPKFMGSTIPFSNEDTETKTTKRMFNLLTDSGGFQMVSLAALSQVTEKGVLFESPYTGKPMLLQPEDSIRCQNQIGADIIMQLDDVISSVATDDDRFRIATFRTLRWYDRCVQAHKFPAKQNLYPIMQGALDVSKGGLRELCLAGFRYRDTQQNRIPGFAIGGLAGGESKGEFWKVVDHACRHLPDDRPRYLMGVGYPLDLVVCTALGVDQYDCVYPTRTARFGVALVDAGIIKLKQHEFGQDDAVIQDECPCQACSRRISRKRLHGLLKSNNNTVAIQLLTQHNVTYMMGLVTRMRKAILNQSYPDFCRKFIDAQFPNPQDVPAWVTDALSAAGISIAAYKEYTVKAEELRRNSCFDPAATSGLRGHLKREWDASFQGLVDGPTSKSKCDEWFEKIFQQHNESGRFYHTAVHLKEMLDYWALLMQQDDSLSPWSNVISWATFFHDAIYNPRSSHNERDSSQLFQQFWKEAFCIDMDKARAPATDTTCLAKLVVMLIHATEKHEITTDPTMIDTEVELQKVFLDVDMAVLGKKKEAYLAYAGLIRKEYAFVDRPVYCEKRAEILTGFLQNKKQIFLSEFFHNALEQQARKNLKDEIDLLQLGAIPGDQHDLHKP